jgi:hypothetical protein
MKMQDKNKIFLQVLAIPHSLSSLAQETGEDA